MKFRAALTALVVQVVGAEYILSCSYKAMVPGGLACSIVTFSSHRQVIFHHL